jgi:hypothetical protein
MKHLLNLLTAGRQPLFQRAKPAVSMMVSPSFSHSRYQNDAVMPSFFSAIARGRFVSSSIPRQNNQEVIPSSALSIPFEQRKAILFHQTWLQIHYCFRESGDESNREKMLGRVKYLENLRKDLCQSQCLADLIESFERYKPAYLKDYGLHPHSVGLFDGILDHLIFGRRSPDIFRSIIADYQSQTYHDIENKVNADFHQIKSMLSEIIQEFEGNPIWTDTAPRPRFCQAIAEATSETDILLALYTIPSSYYFPDWKRTRFQLITGNHFFQLNKMKFFLEMLTYGEPAVNRVNKKIIANHFAESWGERWEHLYNSNDRLIFPITYYGDSTQVKASFEDMTLAHRKTAIFLALHESARKMLSYNHQVNYLKLIPYFYAIFNAKDENDMQAIHSQMTSFDDFCLNKAAVNFYLSGESSYLAIGDIMQCERVVERNKDHSISDLVSEMKNQYQLIKYNLTFLLYFRLNHDDWKKIEAPFSVETIQQLNAAKNESELVEILNRFNLLTIPWAQARKLLTTMDIELVDANDQGLTLSAPIMQINLSICRILQQVPDFVLPDYIKETLTLKYGYVIARDLAHDDERCSQSRWWSDEIDSLSPNIQQVEAYVVKKLKEWILEGKFIEKVTSEITEFARARDDVQVFKEWEKYALPWVPEKMREYDERYLTADEPTIEDSTSISRLI